MREARHYHAYFPSAPPLTIHGLRSAAEDMRISAHRFASR